MLGRLLCAIGVGAVLLVQPAAVLAAPTPSPGLDKILVAPPGAGFAEQPKSPSSGLFEGEFDATGYAQTTAASDSTQTKQALDQDGFLKGYGRTWLSKSTGHGYIEFVMAFTGGKGAKTWLRQSEIADKAEPTYKQALTIAGIDSYYGVKLVDTVNRFYADAYVFVKGNDLILVSYVSGKNDLATIAATQTKRQFDATPAYTIPPAQWPETKTSNTALDVAKLIGAFVIGVVLIGLIGGALLVMRSRRRPGLQPVAVQVAPAVAASVPGTAAEPVPSPPIQMSEDRRSWWDGSAWRDAEHEVPPSAQRSGDGKFWWDGAAWRPLTGS
ncbi:MAG: hypothetical protein QOJ10_1341 [Chloroflexota bacterium]|nr:hypothetical protein [Chloroflexota bacterium]